MAGLTTTEGLQSWLTAHDINVSSVQPLTGGFANYVWRLVYPDGKTAVVKHAEPIVRNHADVNLPAERVNHEANSMRTVDELLSDLKSKVHVSPPSVIFRDSKEHVVIMSDGKGKNLKALYPSLSTDQVQDTGQRLGQWLAELHIRSAKQSTSIGEGGNPSGRSIYRYSYQGLHRVLAEHGLDGTKGQLGHKVNEKYADLLLTDDECVCQGDFWTGNIILNEEQTSPSSSASSATIDLMVVDWEICRRGIPATDVAQFVAEAYLLDRFSEKSHGLSTAFLDSYTRYNPDGSAKSCFWERFLIHWATHVIFWPSYVPWGTKEQMHEVAKFATRLIQSIIEDGKDPKEVLETDFNEELKRVGT